MTRALPLIPHTLQQRLRTSWPWLALATLAAAALVALFHPGLSGGFVFDDMANIAQNPALYMTGLEHVSAWRAASSFPYGPGLRLLPMFSFGLDYFRTGSFDPGAFKATNLAIHVITFFALAGFLRQLLIMFGRTSRQAAGWGLAMSLLWAVHPLQVSSVLYVVQRMQTLATLFVLLALWAYLCMRQAQIQGGALARPACWMLVGWALALASKEDAALLPAYTLLLEVTVLGFAAGSAATTRWLKRGYVLAVVAGLALAMFWAMPRYGSSTTFVGRDFDSIERVLTQGRVLVMYLGQMLWPTPQNLPFYYDNYPVSRGWLAPVSTLLAWASLAVLAILAWCLRRRRPLLALGVLWFFAGHLVTSNVLGLEMAFEHRNHLPLVGLVLAVVDVLWVLTGRLRGGRQLAWVVMAVALLACAGATWQRARVWGNEMALARASVQLAPTSGRAWVVLCQAEFAQSNNDPGSAAFARAVTACQNGGSQGQSAVALSNVITLKAMRGAVTQDDWDRLQARLRSAPMTPENHHIAATLVGNAGNGLPLDTANVLQTVEIIAQRGSLSRGDSRMIASFILAQALPPERALPYLLPKAAAADPELALQLLRAEGQLGLAGQLEQALASQP